MSEEFGGKDVAHVRELLEARWTAHLREHAILEAARKEEVTAHQERHDRMNEIREQLGTQRSEFATKESVEALEKQLVLSERREAQREGGIAVLRFIGFAGLFAGLMALLGLIATISGAIRTP